MNLDDTCTLFLLPLLLAVVFLLWCHCVGCAGLFSFSLCILGGYPFPPPHTVHCRFATSLCCFAWLLFFFLEWKGAEHCIWETKLSLSEYSWGSVAFHALKYIFFKVLLKFLVFAHIVYLFIYLLQGKQAWLFSFCFSFFFLLQGKQVWLFSFHFNWLVRHFFLDQAQTVSRLIFFFHLGKLKVDN